MRGGYGGHPRRVGEDYPFVASHGFPLEFEEFMQGARFAPDEDTLLREGDT